MGEYHLPPGFCSRRQRDQTLECLRRINVVRDPRAKEAVLCSEIYTSSYFGLLRAVNPVR